METIEREDRLLRQKLEMEDEREKRNRRRKMRKQEFIEIEKEKLHFELKMKELELEGKSKPKHLPLDSSKTFDVTKHIRLVRPFQEKEVDKYFFFYILRRLQKTLNVQESNGPYFCRAL